MNELNYASLEASKKLVDNGIVLEADYYWIRVANSPMMLHNNIHGADEYYPAPSMAEVWRELLKLADNNEKIIVSWIQEMNDWQATGADVALLIVEVCSNIEKLAELLIWVKGQEVV